MSGLLLRGLIAGLFLQLVFLQPGFAAIEVHKFDNPTHEKQYKTLIQELRCLVCQNENLASSNADLAKDLRQKIYDMTMRGKDSKFIINYMVARYGDFILYRPPFKSITILLWTGPLLILLLSLWIAFRIIRSRSDSESAISSEQRLQVRSLLEQQDSL
ncbi:MAG TPA: cytochrome c-type biogenesis protein CcmH [Gammaproteobacteria bacterium]|nr:cytochrome c-type biogenesis protein CcmH [Gammaproteobacteria bacterium]